MKTIAFSIKGLLAAVTMIAVGLFALLNASDLWVRVVVLLTLLVFLTALLAFACRPGPWRAFWIGFAIFGWGYFILTNPPLGESYRPLLPTHAALETLTRDTSKGSTIVISVAPGRTVEKRVWRSKWSIGGRALFYRVGHCLWAWLLAVIGGFMARHFYLAQERSQAAREGASQPAGGR